MHTGMGTGMGTGTSAGTHADRGRLSAVSFVKVIVREFRDDDVMGLAAEIAFRLLFALPPLLIFFTALSSIADEYTGVDVFAFLQKQVDSAAIPGAVKETAMLALSTVDNQNATGILSVGIIVALWSASGAFSAMIKALNRAYDVKDGRTFVKQRLLALGLTIGLSVMIITSFVLFVFGGRVGEWLATRAGFGPAFAFTWGIARWPVIAMLIMLALAVLFWAGPAVRPSFRLLSPGSILTALLWSGAVWGFSLYLRLSDLGSAYGTFGTVVVLLFFMYVSSIVLLIGAEVNAILDKQFDPEVVVAKAAHPDRQTEDQSVLLERVERLAGHDDRQGTSQIKPVEAPGHIAKTPGALLASRGAGIALLLSMGSVLLAGFIGALRRRTDEHA